MENVIVEEMDIELVCREPECGKPFIHSVGEQKWMRGKWGDDYKRPIRCRECRKKRREANSSQ